MRAFDWDQELPDSQRDALIENLAQRVDRYRLYLPAILFLEMHKPIAFLASQSLVLGSGLLAPIFGPQNVQQLSKLLESRENVERLIRRIEELNVTAPGEGKV
jgi:hypothetical protein